jgi:hypothetical protein
MFGFHKNELKILSDLLHDEREVVPSREFEGRKDP